MTDAEYKALQAFEHLEKQINRAHEEMNNDLYDEEYCEEYYPRPIGWLPGE